jgi:hypothetical protein
MASGYSGTPLARKLSLKPGLRAWWEDVPRSVRHEIGLEELGVELLDAPEPPIDAAHVFVTSRAALEDAVARLRPLLAPSGFLWVSWPKKASKVPTDVTEDVVRDVALPTGLVDVKVCAVDSVWSGLKLMIRRSER